MMGQGLLSYAGSVRGLSAIMVLLCFFCSMVITNDVTLITFVPFTILVFRMVGKESRIVRLVVLETVAANLGSMATPIGNPQNLYLYSVSGLSAGEFMAAVLPYAGLSLALLLLAVFMGKKRTAGTKGTERGKGNRRKGGGRRGGGWYSAVSSFADFMSPGGVPGASVPSGPALCGGSDCCCKPQPL